MSYKDFFALGESTVSRFVFWIDTRNIVAGATDGSENPLTFRFFLGNASSTQHNFIIKVNDGRADYAYNPGSQNSIITFATAGIYKITFVGSSPYILGPGGTDKNKWIYLDAWGSTFKLGSGSSLTAFPNLEIRFKETLKLSGSRSFFFRSTKGFSPEFDMSKLDVSDVTNFSGFLSNISLPFYSALNPFINVATSLSSLYLNANMASVPKVEIISNTVTDVSSMLSGTGFQGQLIINAPVTNLNSLLEGVVNPPALGKVNIVNVTNLTGVINQMMSTANVDATLLGWANLDWSNRGTKKSTYNFYNSKYSNNPEVISAKSFLEGKGLTFANLTMQT